MLIDCQNIKDKAIANRKILKQYGKYLYPSIRLNAFNSPSWRLPTVSEGKELLNNFNKINQNIQNIGGKIEIIPNVIWAQDNSYIDFEHNQIGVSQDNDDCFAIRRVMNIDTNLIENKQYNKNRNMKRTIKLRESELKRMIAESVKRVLNEEHGGTYIQGVLKAIEDAIYSAVDTEIARMAIGDRENMMRQTLAQFVKDTFSDACALQRKTDALDSKIIDTPPSGTFF